MKRIIKKITGCILIIGSACLPFLWFYKLAPLRHLSDHEWYKNHSESALWNEEQKKYHRLGSSPDLSCSYDLIGYYGDEKWLKWLINKMKEPNFRVCGCTETVLMHMTNQYHEDWDKWLDKNKDKTQEQWIEDGFAKSGLKISYPPKTKDIRPLLELLGGETWNVLYGGPKDEKTAPKTVPSYMKYNALLFARFGTKI